MASEADKKLEEIMATTLESALTEGTYTKLQAQVKTLLQHKDLGKITAELRKKTENNNDADEATEATQLLERLTRYADYIKQQAEASKDTDPTQCSNTYQRLTKEFEGDQISTKAKKTLEELKKDKVFQKNIEADKKLAAIEELAGKFKPCQNGKPLDIKGCTACHKKNQTDLDTINALTKSLQTQYPGSPAAGKVKDLLNELGIEIK
jgi:hypothetical protein